MRIKDVIYLFFMCYAVFTLAAPLAAMHYEGGGYDLWLVPNSGSSVDLNPSGPIHLQDIKGYPFGLFYGDQLVTGLGTLVTTGTVEITEAGTAELADIGRIRETNIVRNGENLEISWGYNPLGAIAAKIYMLSGVGQEHNTEAAQYSVLASVPSSTSKFVHAATAHDGNHYYYRVVPDPLVNPSVFSDENNSITVGKTETAMPANKFVFCGLPFMEDGASLAGLLGDQVGSGGDFLWWNGTAYQGATYATGWVGTDRNIRVGEGFIVRAKTDRPLALVGRFGTFVSPYERDLANNQFALLAHSKPTQKLLEAMGIAPVPDADLLRWLVSSQVYDGATYSGTAWVGATEINLLLLGRPRFYRPKAAFVWQIL